MKELTIQLSLLAAVVALRSGLRANVRPRDSAHRGR